MGFVLWLQSTHRPLPWTKTDCAWQLGVKQPRPLAASASEHPKRSCGVMCAEQKSECSTVGNLQPGFLQLAPEFFGLGAHLEQQSRPRIGTLLQLGRRQTAGVHSRHSSTPTSFSRGQSGLLHNGEQTRQQSLLGIGGCLQPGWMQSMAQVRQKRLPGIVGRWCFVHSVGCICTGCTGAGGLHIVQYCLFPWVTFTQPVRTHILGWDDKSIFLATRLVSSDDKSIFLTTRLASSDEGMLRLRVQFGHSSDPSIVGIVHPIPCKPGPLQRDPTIVRTGVQLPSSLPAAFGAPFTRLQFNGCLLKPGPLGPDEASTELSLESVLFMVSWTTLRIAWSIMSADLAAPGCEILHLMQSFPSEKDG